MEGYLDPLALWHRDVPAAVAVGGVGVGEVLGREHAARAGQLVVALCKRDLIFYSTNCKKPGKKEREREK